MRCISINRFEWLKKKFRQNVEVEIECVGKWRDNVIIYDWRMFEYEKVRKSQEIK